MAQITFTNTGGITAEDTIASPIFKENGTNLASKYAAIGHNHDSSYVAKASIADNLTTNDASKVLSAKQGKVLQDNKLPYYSTDSSKWDTTPTQSSNKPVTSNGIYQITSNLQTRMTAAENKVGRNMGELVFSSTPISDASLHLADGSFITSSVYNDFYNYIVGLYNQSCPTVLSYSAWQTEKNTNGGPIGKYGYDLTNSRVYLPDLTDCFVEGTVAANELGKFMEAGIPNVKGEIVNMMADTSGYQYNVIPYNPAETAEGSALYAKSSNEPIYSTGNLYNSTTKMGGPRLGLDASRCNDVYSDTATTVQPQATKQYVYIVLANSIKSEAQVDVDKIMTEINTINSKIDNITKRNIGELVLSSVPMNDPFLLLANGQSITRAAYQGLYDYIVSLYNSGSAAVTTGTAADTGKYVYDSANSRIFLPNLDNLFIQGTTSASDLGKFMSAGLPNIMGKAEYNYIGGNASQYFHGALEMGDYRQNISYDNGSYGNLPQVDLMFNAASGEVHNGSYSNKVYGKSDTVQPPAVKQYIYIVAANGSKNDGLLDVVGKIDANMTNLGINPSNYHLMTFSGDCNNITKTSVYFTQVATNTPSGTSNGYLTTSVFSNEYIRQTYKPYDESTTYERTKKYNTWGSWFPSSYDLTPYLLWSGPASASIGTYTLNYNWDIFRKIIFIHKHNNNGTTWYTPVYPTLAYDRLGGCGFHLYSAYGSNVQDVYGSFSNSDTSKMLIEGSLSGELPFLVAIYGYFCP